MALLVGSEFYGVDLSEANNICLPPEGVLKHDPAHLQNCSSWSQAFQLIEVATASFIERKYVFDAIRMKYMAVVETSNKAIQEYVGSAEFVEMVEATPKKDEFMINAVNSRLQTPELTAVQQQLQAEIAKLKLAANLLKATLLEKAMLIEKFLAECNDLYVGTGPNDEYLLDICAQESTACLEQDGGHVTCCCAYHPFTAYGEAA